jgi:hypothetical protein
MSTSKDYDLNIWQANTASIFSVQGESISRTINFCLKEEVKVENARGEFETQLKPFDATGYTARLFVEKSDNTKVFFDGTVTDGVNGEISFTLPHQATVISGEIPCTVYLSKSDGTTLKAIGITLDVQQSDLEGAVESSNEFSTLVVALNSITASVTAAQQAVANANTAVSTANAASSTASTAATNANAKAVLAQTAADAANTAAEKVDTYYRMIDPTTGQEDYVVNVVKNLENYMFANQITASQFEALNKTAAVIDGLSITARDFDTIAKTLLS